MDVETRIRSGTLRGQLAGGVAVFRGIPFAAAPAGPRRFRPPEPAQPWDGARAAVSPGPGCPQPVIPGDPFDAYFNPANQGEDCLNLDVWTPDVGGSGLPVMVWIHGGAYMTGGGSVPAHDGATFARDGVVHVSVNYRLNVEGFLYLEGQSANLGLQDQVAALRWVAENISAFGGDPANVTIFGQSAGAVSVMNLLAMPSALGLFRRAIAQSGAPNAAVPPGEAMRATRRLAEILDIAPTAEAFAAAGTARTMPGVLPLVLEFNNPLLWGPAAFMVSPFRAVIDDATLPEAVLPAVTAGASAGVDLLAGTTRDETTGFLQALGLLDDFNEGWGALALQAFGLTTDSLDTYRKASRPNAGGTELVQAAWTDWAFRIPTLGLLAAHRGRSFAYEFTWQSPGLPEGFGANHALEIPFVRDGLDTFRAVGPAAQAILGEHPPEELARAMHRAWVQFATHGDPGWVQYEETKRVTMRFDTVSGPVEDLAGAERELWHGPQ